MIKINKISEITCELYNPNDELVGIIDNILSFTDVRCQIYQQQVSGYYIKWNDFILPIDHNGRINQWPNGFYEEYDNMLHILLGL